MPGLLVFSARLVIALLLAPLRAAARLLMRSEPEPPPAPPQPPPAPTPPPPRPRRRRAEPTRGQVAAMREAVREAETGGPDSVGADVHVAEPWPGYDDMGLEDVLGRLQTATEVELAVVRAYEREHEARQAVLLATGETP
jgi:hypothetical protein